jgi:hypothetical protein
VCRKHHKKRRIGASNRPKWQEPLTEKKRGSSPGLNQIGYVKHANGLTDERTQSWFSDRAGFNFLHSLMCLTHQLVRSSIWLSEFTDSILIHLSFIGKDSLTCCGTIPMEAALESALIVKLLIPRYNGKGLEISPNQVSISGSYLNLTKRGSMRFSLTFASTPCIKVFREFRNQSNRIGSQIVLHCPYAVSWTVCWLSSRNMLTTVFTES